MSKKIIGDVDLSNLYLKRLPDILKDITVSGHFGCYYNKLTTLVGAPTNVVGRFDCSNNNLTSLVGAPKTVGGHFYCNDNPGKFTREQVRAVCNVKGNIYV